VEEGIESPVLQPFVEKLKKMLYSDRDAQVIGAVIQTLDEIYRLNGGIECDLKLFKELLRRTPEFNEWGLSSVLNVIIRYKPSNRDDMFEAMNILDPCLRQTNSAIVLGCCKLFAMYAELVPDIKTSVYFRLKEPLLTLMLTSGSMVELKFATLCHIQILVKERFVEFVYFIYSHHLQPNCV
jgi:vesicle coat complex subunit